MLHRPLYRFLGQFLRKHDRRKLATKILLEPEFDYGIRNAQLVNSRSLLFSCDVHPDNPQSSILDKTYLDSIPNKLQAATEIGSSKLLSIYVPSDGLSYFAQHILPKIKQEFVLVSGDSDLPINTKSLGINLDHLLQSPLLKRWFAQNRDYDHPKLQSLPIGINLHNLWSNPLEWGGGFILPSMQEQQLLNIARKAPELSQRQHKIFCNWHFSIDRADRKDCYELIDKSVCYFQPEPRPMAQTWEQQSQYQFVLSPHGAGLDCHRTWEAMLLGCIVILKNAKLNDLFSSLPVIVVNDWQEISPAFLDQAIQSINEKKIDKKSLFIPFWQEKITGEQ